MPRGVLIHPISTLPALVNLVLYPVALCKPAIVGFEQKVDWRPAPDPSRGPTLFPRVLDNPAYLPAEIGGIVAAYGVSLVFVAITLLALAKKRREHLKAAKDDFAFEVHADLYSPEQVPVAFNKFPDASEPAKVPNFSYPSPIATNFNRPTVPIQPSPISIANAPGINLGVDQTVVQADREMAQQQLEEMYRYVMEHDEAKRKGIVLDAPVIPGQAQRCTQEPAKSKKEKFKPANLNLGGVSEGKSHSKAHSFFSALRSPRKKSAKTLSISSPIMTPQSSTFSGADAQEMGLMTPRPYAPVPPTVEPSEPAPIAASRTSKGSQPMTPDMSPQSVQSIDERLQAQLSLPGSSRTSSQPVQERDPASATSEHSLTPLVGLPSSPKPGARFPTLPSSPVPGATFRRPNAPSAVRTGGTLPLRAYEPAMDSPSAIATTTKQTVFERRGPLSPTTGRTPRTAGTVPYTPYQPNTPCIPVTPSLVTKEDRKRMKRMIPKTPTLEMVKSNDEMW
ncbi:hypothetical protein HIM_03807 [Hirsutella minnesotensis 3608]|uniref:Uncharacterized protein n=1 Tax=Hirsutella minnesotensis 3608 TaxID=1043627 RepID=A0A0F7ZQA9_9HYPO|nr:hypothetical protein HIM_03807 [Hirsutella minnesotensis 3608]